MSLIFGDFLQNWLGPRKVAAWTFYGVMLVGFVAARAPTTLSPWGRESVEMVALQSEIARLEQLLEVTDEPILAASPHGFLQTAFYASPELRARLRYVALPSAALEFLSTDSGERALINIAPWAGLETRAC